MMDKVKVLMVLNNPGRSGAQTYAVNVLRSINRNKFQVDFLFSVDKENSYKEEIMSLGSNIYFIPQFKVFNYFKYCTEWHHFLENNNYDIVHGHVSSSASIYLKIAKQHGCKTIAHSHSTGYRGNFYERLVKRFFTIGAKWYADYWFACSDKAAERLFGRQFKNNSRFFLMPNSIDVSRFLFNNIIRENIRKEIGIEKDIFVCGHVGSFSSPKNHKFLLNVFKIVLENNKKSKLVLVGDGYLRKEIEEYAMDLGVFDSIIFTGNVGNANEYMMAMDCMIFPSVFEGFGFAILEAQATGLYTLMSDTIPDDVVLTDIVKVLSLSEDALEWKKAIGMVPLGDRTKYNDLIKESNYNMEKKVVELSDLYNKIARERN